MELNGEDIEKDKYQIQQKDTQNTTSDTLHEDEAKSEPSNASASPAQVSLVGRFGKDIQEGKFGSKEEEISPIKVETDIKSPSEVPQTGGVQEKENESSKFNSQIPGASPISVPKSDIEESIPKPNEIKSPANANANKPKE